MPYNDDTSAHDEWYPLGEDDRHWIDGIVQLIRSHTPHMSPIELRGASTVLLALARLPRSSPGIDVEFGFRTEPIQGNHAWAYISVSDDGFVLGVGEHFYDPAVGGDTESSWLFATQAASRGAAWVASKAGSTSPRPCRTAASIPSRMRIATTKSSPRWTRTPSTAGTNTRISASRNLAREAPPFVPF